ncbi:MAG: hypothetical protein JSR66_04565 [Proteobacteria bacterium]|nr:hypothetical protein [Pseudomonadota bacterium]
MLARIRFESFALLTVMSAWAAAQPADLSSTLRVSRIVVTADGSEVRRSADSAGPGDVLEYVAEYHNNSTHVIRQLAATLPIPDGTELLPTSALPAGALASTDGTHFSVVPLTRKALQADGKLVDQPIPYREYRYLRWPPRDLFAGQSLQVAARARLPDEPSGPRPAH